MFALPARQLLVVSQDPRGGAIPTADEHAVLRYLSIYIYIYVYAYVSTILYSVFALPVIYLYICIDV